MFKKKAFTLAEILITLSIIGIISVMVLPRLMKTTEEKVLATKTKHFYSMMSQMTRTYMANNGLFSLKNMVDCTQVTCAPDKKTNTLQHMIESTLKISQKCEKAEDCFKIMSMGDGSEMIPQKVLWSNNSMAYVLIDGYTIALSRRNSYSDIRLLVDVNGAEGPNIFGRDIWFMNIRNDGSIRTDITSSNASNCDSSYSVCFGNFVKSGYKMYMRL